MNIKQRVCLAVSLLFTLHSGIALAQPSSEASDRAVRRLESVPDTTLRSPFVAPTPVFNLESSADDTTANALWGVQYGDLTLSLKFSGPIRKGAATQFADLDGLRNKASVDAGIGWLYWTAPDPATALAPACRRLAEIRGNPPNTGCTLKELRDAQRENEAVLVPYIDSGNAFYFTARVKGAREDFDFLDPVSLESMSEKKSSSSFTAGAGWLTRTNWMLAANYRHEDTYAAASGPVDVCRPVDATTAMTCSEAVIGPPTRTQSELWQIEVRKFLGGGLAISPRLTRNVSKNITGFEFPLYFIKGAGGNGLTGGVTAGWRSDQRGPTVVLFVGQALGIWNR
jgi:hypothetical protein